MNLNIRPHARNRISAASALILAFCSGGCHQASSSQAVSGSTPPRSLQPLLLLTTKTGNPRGDAESAEAYERLTGQSVEAVLALEKKQFITAGWVPLKKNQAEWSKMPQGREALGYFKDGYYYVMFIHQESDRKSLRVLHNITRQLQGPRSYFLPATGSGATDK